MYYYKLNKSETIGLLQHFRSSNYIDTFIKVAEHRVPHKFLAEEVVQASRVYLNKAKTIWVQVIHFYGGENFNEPHYFVSEICHITTNSVFSRFANKYKAVVPLYNKIPFSY